MPTYTSEHYLLTFGGGLLGGEEWQCGLRFRQTGGGSSPSEQIDNSSISLSDIYDDIAALISNTSQGFPAATSLNWVKLAAIKTDGYYATDPQIHSPATPAVGASVAFVPNQIAMVASLWTGVSLGTGNRGRIYLPAPAQDVGTDGRWVLSLATGLVTRVRDMINAVNGEISTIAVPTEPAIMASVTAHQAGSEKAVTTVRIGRVPDTQRRRRTDLDEDYQEATL